MADEDEAADAVSAAKPSGPPLVLLLLGVLNLVGVGFVGWKVIGLETAAHKSEEDAKAASLPGPVVPMDPFVVNLNEPGSNRYLKMGFELELANVKAQEKLEASKRAVRDEVLRFLSGLAVADTQGESAKKAIQEQILLRVRKVLGHGSVKQLFFTDFLVQ